MSIDVNAIEQTVVVTAVGDEVNVNIIDQPVLVSVTDQIIEVEASGGTGPQGPAGAGVAAGGTTGQVLSKASNANYDTAWVDAGAGTVYSVDASGSTGISVTGGPITGAGVLTITNTLPDQVVSLTGAGTAVITGTYPNFTITTNDEFDGTVTSVNLTAGTGISVSGGPITSSGAINVVNTAPDQVVSLTGGGTTTISGTYPNFTISSSDQYTGTVTSVNMTVPTGLTISGNPITSAGTLALALASGYSIPTTASQANWNTAYNDSITSASVSGTSTKTLTLNQQDGGTVTASWSDIDTGLTSVGLSMPSAFAVANSPLTSNGTIAVTGAGTSAQYVRGDGQLANFPTSGGGGSSVNYYLNGSVSQGTFGGDTYYEMSKSPIGGVGTNFTRTSAQGNGYIASFITDANDPGLLNIPGGNWNLEFYFNASSGGGNPLFYGEIYKVSSSNVFTLVASGSTNPEGITQGTVVDQYFTSIPVVQTSLLATDRIAIRIYVIPDGRNITLHTENSNLCEILTTFSTGLNALNGLTSQVQYFATGTSGTDFNIQSLTDTHTFNLPVASGSNTGKLSNIDWLTFDGKENVLTFSAPLSRSVNTVSIPVANASQPGYLDSTDWTTFNAKVTSVSATSPLFSSGGKTPTLTIQQASGSQNGYLSSTDWATFNNKQNAITLTTTGASGASTFIGSTLNIPTYTLTGLGGVPTTRQLTINGTAYDLSADRSWTIPVHDAVTIGTANGLSLSTQVLSLGLSSSSANGALSSTDWSTFNSKQSAITLTTTGSSGASTFISNTLNIPTYTLSGLGGVPTTRTLTINGTTYDLSANRTWNVGTVTTAAATTGGQVAFFNGATVITSVSGLYFDGVDKLGIGTASPTYNLDVTGTARMISSSNLQTLYLQNSGTGYGLYNQADSYFQGDVKFQSVSNTILKVNASNKLIAAVAGTDYQAPITNPVTGTGTTNYLPKWTSGSALGNSSIQESSSLIGVNVTPTRVLHLSSSGLTSAIRLDNTVSGRPFLLTYDDSQNLTFINSSDSGYTAFNSGTGASTTKMLLTNGGNLLVNSVVDNGNRLQVTGNGYFSGNVGVGTSSPQVPLSIASSGNNWGLFIGPDAGGATGKRLKLGYYGTANHSVIQSIQDGVTTTSLVLQPDGGNLGLGVVPSAWGVTALQRGSSSFFEYSTNNTIVASNYYYPGGANNLYMNNGYASFYQQYNGQHAWYNAPSGTAGNAITFTQAMTLTSGGNLLLNTTTDSGERLVVNGSANVNGLFVISNSTGIPAQTDSLLRFASGFASPDIGRMYIGDGTGWKFHFSKRIASTTTDVITFFDTGAATFSSSVTARQFYSYIEGQTALRTYTKNANVEISCYQSDAGSPYLKTTDIVANADSGVASQMRFLTATTSSNPAEAMRITSGGNLLVGTSTNPGSKLYVVGSSARLENTSSTFELDIYGNSNILRIASGSTSASIQTLQNNPIIFGTGASEKVRITSGGNLLVGTTTDSGERLQVNGGTRTGGIVITGNSALPSQTSAYTWMASGFASPDIGRLFVGDGTGWKFHFSKRISNANTDLVTIQDNGRVGIGTSTPGSKLSIVGLPTSSAGLSAGDIWNDGGTLKIV